MRSVYLVLFLLTATAGLSQSVQSIRIDSLPPQGIVLDKGWKWHPGDNPDWAKPEFDDSRWVTIDPTQDIMSLPQLKKASLGWLRLTIDIDSALFGNTVALLSRQSGASEIYLNGILLHKYGVIAHNPTETRGYNPQGSPIAFPFSNNHKQTLAIRYGTPPIFWVRFINTVNPALMLRVCRIESVVDVNHGVKTEEWNNLSSQFQGLFKAGFYFILGLFHLAFFVYYKDNKSNLYFSLYCLVTSIIHLSFPVFQLHDVRTINYLSTFFNLLIPVSVIMALLAVQKLLDEAKGILFWSTILVFVASLPLMIRPYEWGGLVGSLLLFFLVMVSVSQMAWQARRKGKNGASGILLASISFFFFYILFLLLLDNPANSSSITFLRNVAYNIAVLSLPTAISFALAREFAQTSRSLSLKLKEVEILSAEKQQILSSQNETLEKQVAERTTQLNHSLETLKATQAQLIQKEKMASLGELTAGIAHEIQNPLNFVNNFSEVSTELLDELREEIQADHKDDALTLAGDLSQNLQKITQHGQRASAIVKGMLDHSRASIGEPQPTDLNRLVDESLRLAYQGFKPKNKDQTNNHFHPELHTAFDPALGLLDVVPQEIGRVLLNLFNNAFYTVWERQQLNPNSYLPAVSVHTKRVENGVEIRIRDNGRGMSESVKAKVFQPFFTTKPVGEGTGLGLSLSYDIVTKGHGGMLTVSSQEGEGTEFVLSLPTR